MKGLQAERVAEVIVRRDDGSEFRGSGYLVRTALVLTAEHAVRRAVGITVRFEADRRAEWTAEADVYWSDRTGDVALLTLREAPRRPAGRVRPARFGAVREVDAGLTCSALGFPLFKLRADADGRGRFREPSHALGEIALLADRRSRNLEFRVQQPGYDPDRRRSPWEGMSGAAVWAHGRIIGVVIEHHREEGLGTLTVSRADKWAERTDDEGKAALRRAGVVRRLRPVAPLWRNGRVVLGSVAGVLAVGAALWFATAPDPAPPLQLRILGTCTHVGQELTNKSHGFTPHGPYTDEVLAPDGQSQSRPQIEMKGMAKEDGSVGWHWTCSSDDLIGTYRVRVTDDTTHRSTGWVTFDVASLTPYACETSRRNGLWYAGISTTGDAVLGPGAIGPDVAEAQCLLQHLGFPLGTRGVDGAFGEYTRQAVVSLQQEGHLPVDGRMGKATWQLLRTRTPPGR